VRLLRREAHAAREETAMSAQETIGEMLEHTLRMIVLKHGVAISELEVHWAKVQGVCNDLPTVGMPQISFNAFPVDKGRTL
jgi:hypothetical protein